MPPAQLGSHVGCGQEAFRLPKSRSSGSGRTLWFGLGWKVNADLPNPDAFEAATAFVTPEQVADAIACGPDVEEHVARIKPFVDAGFTEIALVQIGDDQQEKLVDWAERELLPALRSL